MYVCVPVSVCVLRIRACRVRLRIASDCGRAVCLRLLLGFSRFSRAVSVDRLRCSASRTVGRFREVFGGFYMQL